MILNWNAHPYEIRRKIRCFYRDLLSDFEIRYPEARRRLAIELKLVLEPQDAVLFETLIRRFESAKIIISFFDWSLLLEWNEWRLQAECLASIQARLKEGLSERDPEAQLKIRERFLEITTLIRKDILENDPSLSRCISFRWKFSAIREEANYYMQRWDELRQDSRVLAS